MALTAKENLVSFQDDLRSLSSGELLRRYVTAAEPVILNAHQYAGLKERVSDEFRVHKSAICMVGSAKLGFSIKPGRRYELFGDKSDVDLAIISEELFVRVWKEAFDFQRSGSYWPNEDSFKAYVFRGWIRPDKLPIRGSFIFTKQWWDFFQQLTSSRLFGPYPIRCGLYHSDHFFQAFQRICIDQCKQDKESQNENIGN